MSRVYLGVHWATDVLGGWVFGLLWLAGVTCTWAAFARRPRYLHRFIFLLGTSDGKELFGEPTP